MNINENKLFFIPIAQTNLEEIDNKKLSEEIYKIKENDSGGVFSNQGGWHSKYLSSNDVYDKKEFLNLSSLISEVVNYMVKQWGIRNSKLSNSSAWCNINQYKDFNIPHSHPSSIMSAVYYVSTNDNAGGIVFIRPDNQKLFFVPDETNDYTEEKSFFLPKNGDLLIFPSYLEHYVLPNLSDNDRISVAYNFFD